MNKYTISVVIIFITTILFCTVYSVVSSVFDYKLKSEKMHYEHIVELQKMEYMFDLSEFFEDSDIYLERYKK